MYLLIVTGLSGAGKSLALRCLEEEGYFTVDNLPSQLLKQFCTLCDSAVPAIKKVAVTIDSRESLLSRSPQNITDAIDALDRPYEILFLDARDDVLQKRYNEVRRRHPLGDAGDCITGVQRERVFIQGMRDRANYILDTSDVKASAFPRFIANVLPEYESRDLSVLVCSFGYKRGVPVDADIVYDMRFMENPFYDPNLRPLSGLDTPIQDFVRRQPCYASFMDAAEQMLRALLPSYDQQGKQILRICFGCTGGRHRSVAAAQEMSARLTAHGINVRVFHRDLVSEAADIASRHKG